MTARRAQSLILGRACLSCCTVSAAALHQCPKLPVPFPVTRRPTLQDRPARCGKNGKVFAFTGLPCHEDDGVRCEAHAWRHMLDALSQEVCNEAAQQEAVCAAYNVRSSSCAFMDEALLWHADCAGASFQQLCCSCSSDAAESLRLYSAFNVPLLSPPALHKAFVLGAALPMIDSRSAYTKVSLCSLAWLCLAGDTGDIS